MIELRPVEESDLEIFYVHQVDQEAAAMAVFGSRDREAHLAHWRTRILANADGLARTILVDGTVAGNMLSWPQDGRRYVGYWIGREFWGRGVATEGLRQFVAVIGERPLYAWVALSNIGSQRVLEKAGFIAEDPQPPPEHNEVPELLYVLR